MGMWEIFEEGHGDYSRGSDAVGYNRIDEAYREGCRHGYEKALREFRGSDMGHRNYGGGRGGEYGGSDMGERGMSASYPDSPAYGERRGVPPYYSNEDMGERRRRRGNGEFM